MVRPSAEPITAVVADRVRELRERAGMSQGDLARAMNRQGVRWKRATVVNLEKRGTRSRGETAGRDAVTVQELLVLAYVLGVPVVTLLADPRQTNKVPVTSALELDPWDGLQWLVGRLTVQDRQAPRSDTWDSAWHLVHDGFTIWEALDDLRTYEDADADDPDEIQEAQRRDAQRHRVVLRRLRRALGRVERAGAVRPYIPDWALERARELEIKLPGYEEG